MPTTVCKCCANKPLPGRECEMCGRKGERVVFKRDILLHLQQHIGVLRDSYRVRFGPDKNKIVEPAILFEIRCIEAAVKIVMGSDAK